MNISFTKKYRPLKFSDLIFQDDARIILENILKTDSKISSFLFFGDRGCGKTSAARIFASALNCENISNNNFEPCLECQSCLSIRNQTNLDVLEIDAASNNSVENIRLIIENSKYLPQSSKKKVYILDEVHMLSLSAFNALLKILEEPPEYVVFILITTEYKKLPLTVISRCLRIQFKKLAKIQISEFLERICRYENIKFEKKALDVISILSEGAVRDSLSLLESASILSNSDIKFDLLSEIFGILNDRNNLFQIFENLFRNNIDEVFTEIEYILKNGGEIISFLQNLITFISEIILIRKKYDFLEILTDLDELNKIDFASFEIFSSIEQKKIFEFLKFNQNLLSFEKLFRFLEILNNGVKIFNQNIYQNEMNFLKILFVKLSLEIGGNEYESHSFKKNLENNKANYFDKNINDNSQNFDKNINKENRFLDFYEEKKLCEEQKNIQYNNLEENNDSKSFNRENINDFKEEECFDEQNRVLSFEKEDKQHNDDRKNLIEILKQNNETFLSDLVCSKKIKIDFEFSFIVDDNLTPSKHLQYLLRILRENFHSSWRIVLEENFEKQKIIQKENVSQQKNETLYIHKEKVFFEQKKSILSQSDDIKKKTNNEIKEEILKSKFFKKMREFFKICEDDVTFIK